LLLLLYKSMNKKLSAFVITIILIAVVFHVRVWLYENFLLGYSLKNGRDIDKVLIAKGLTRRYLVHLPEDFSAQGEKEKKIPLVLVLHGAGGNAKLAREITGMNQVADKKNFIVVYPDGTGLFNYMLSWNAGECCNYVEPFGIDDVDFLRRVIEQMKEDYNIDTQRIYVAGLSNGGMMAYYLACELADEIAAIASVSSSMWIDDCAPSDYLSVIAFHGAKDTVIPFGGGRSYSWFVNLFDLNFFSVEEAVSFWVGHNGCADKIIERGDLKTEKIIYGSCESNSEVVLYKLGEAGHIWPGGKKSWFLADEPVDYINASEIIWNFFENHPKIKKDE